MGFKHGVINTVRNIDEKVFNIKKPPTQPKQNSAFIPYRQSTLMNSTIPNFKSSTTVPAVVNIGQVVVDKNGMAVATKATTTIPNMISP